MKNQRNTYSKTIIKERISQKQECRQAELFQFHNSDNYSDYSDYYVYGDSDYSISLM